MQSEKKSQKLWALYIIEFGPTPRNRNYYSKTKYSYEFGSEKPLEALVGTYIVLPISSHLAKTQDEKSKHNQLKFIELKYQVSVISTFYLNITYSKS